MKQSSPLKVSSQGNFHFRTESEVTQLESNAIEQVEPFHQNHIILIESNRLKSLYVSWSNEMIDE